MRSRTALNTDTSRNIHTTLSRIGGVVGGARAGRGRLSTCCCCSCAWCARSSPRWRTWRRGCRRIARRGCAAARASRPPTSPTSTPTTCPPPPALRPPYSRAAHPDACPRPHDVRLDHSITRSPITDHRSLRGPPVLNSLARAARSNPVLSRLYVNRLLILVRIFIKCWNFSGR